MAAPSAVERAPPARDPALPTRATSTTVPTREPAEHAAAPSVGAPSEPAEIIEPPPAALLDPGAVARAWLREHDPAEGPSTPRRHGGREGLTSVRSGVEERARERALTADLRSRALTKAHARRPLALDRRPDGSYVHRGHGFTAIIRPDGSVEFRDRDPVSVDGASASRIDPSGRLVDPSAPPVLPELATRPGGLVETAEAPEIVFGVGGRFDLQGALMRAAGGDPWAAARLRFLEETEALRDELTDRHAAALRARALRALPARLHRIWRDRSMPRAERRARIAAMRDECSDDPDGRAARAIIERFLAEEAR